jgi:hypothetical protein
MAGLFGLLFIGNKKEKQALLFYLPGISTFNCFHNNWFLIVRKCFGLPGIATFDCFHYFGF